MSLWNTCFLGLGFFVGIANLTACRNTAASLADDGEVNGHKEVSLQPCDSGLQRVNDECVPISSVSLVIDHTAVGQFASIPDWALEKAKDLTMFYSHTSHGSQILAGLTYLKDHVDTKYDWATRSPYQNSVGGLALPTSNGHRISEGYGHPYQYWEGSAAIADTDAVIDSGLFTLSMWSWCGQVSDHPGEYIQEYLDTMMGFEGKHPDTRFVYMTGHRDTNPAAYNKEPANNAKIRDHVSANKRILFDFADIESFRLDGTESTDEDGGCNWCEAWCANNAHPDDCRNLPAECDSGSETCCAHSHGLNCVIKAKAYWVMLARLSGWTPG